jgi:hypothetical protein
MIDLRQFVQNNQSLQELYIESNHDLTPDQVDLLQGAIPAATQLKKHDTSRSHFANDGSLEWILLACTKVKRMVFTCEFVSHYAALSTLLQD